MIAEIDIDNETCYDNKYRKSGKQTISKGGNPMKKFFASLIVVTTMLFLVVGCDQGQTPAPKYDQISGVVAEVQYIAQGSSFNAPDIKQTIVSFEDGRVKAFNGISNEVIQKGKTNVIYYNKYNNIVSVEIR